MCLIYILRLVGFCLAGVTVFCIRVFRLGEGDGGLERCSLVEGGLLES